MIRIAIGLAAVFLLVPATARGEESTAEKVERLEKALEEQKQHYENEIGGLRRRIDDLEGRSGESELDRVIREMELEAETAIEEGTMGPTAAPAQTLKNAFNPRITMFGDFTARLDDRAVFSEGHHHGHEEEEEHEGEEHEEEEGARADDRAALRSFEIDARADIDPFAKAVVVLGIHEEEPGGEYGVETEELYATFETLPWRLRAKVGKFRASMGTINRLHMHDLPQTTAPLVVTEWFGAEGLNVTGAEVSWLAPETFVDSLEITLGVMNGEEDLLGNEDAQDPSWLGRIQLFEEASDSTWFQVGSSHHLGWTDRSSENLSRISGIDLLYRWRPKRRALETSFFAQAEVYRSYLETDEDDDGAWGGFALAQYQPARDVYLGARYDWLEPREDHEDEPDDAWAVGLWVSYYTSEFLRFRVGWEHREVDGERDLDTLYFQFTFVFGSHPVEPYWFNK